MPRYSKNPSPRDARLQRLALLQEANARQDQVDSNQQASMMNTMDGMFRMQQEQQLAPERLKQLQGANELQGHQNQIAASDAAWKESGMQQKYATGGAELQRGLAMQHQEELKNNNLPTELEQGNRVRESAIAGQDATNRVINNGKGAEMNARMEAMYKAKQMFPDATPEQLDAVMRGGPTSTPGAAAAPAALEGESGPETVTGEDPPPPAPQKPGSEILYDALPSFNSDRMPDWQVPLERLMRSGTNQLINYYNTPYLLANTAARGFGYNDDPFGYIQQMQQIPKRK